MSLLPQALRRSLISKLVTGTVRGSQSQNRSLFSPYPRAYLFEACNAYATVYRVSLPKEGSNAQILDLKQIILIYCTTLEMAVRRWHTACIQEGYAREFPRSTLATPPSTLGLQDVTREHYLDNEISYVRVGSKAKFYVSGRATISQ